EVALQDRHDAGAVTAFQVLQSGAERPGPGAVLPAVRAHGCPSGECLLAGFRWLLSGAQGASADATPVLPRAEKSALMVSPADRVTRFFSTTVLPSRTTSAR